jgi:hypothetical protein
MTRRILLDEDRHPPAAKSVDVATGARPSRSVRVNMIVVPMSLRYGRA